MPQILKTLDKYYAWFIWLGFVTSEIRRKELHKMFGFPRDRPLFRKANAFVFPEEVDTRGYLRSPHIGLPPSGGKQLQEESLQ